MNDPRPLLDRWRRSLGGRERLARIRSYRASYRVRDMGLVGRAEEWHLDCGWYRFDLSLGGGRLRHVITCDGIDVWCRELNGRVTRRVGVAQRAEVTRRTMASWSHLLDDRAADWITAGGPDPKGRGQWVRIAPEGGLPIDVYLDDERCLPYRTEMVLAGELLVELFEAWQWREGVLFAGRRRRWLGDPEYSALYCLEEVVFNRMPLSLMVRRPPAAPPQLDLPPHRPSRALPLRSVEGLPFLQLHVNGAGPFWFLLDTGAQQTLLHEQTRRVLGLEAWGRLRGRGVGRRSVPVRLAAGVRLGAPGFEVRSHLVAVMDLSEVEAAVGHPIDGILGMDVLGHLACELDMEAEELRLARPENEPLPPPPGGTAVPLVMRGGLPYVTCRMGLPSGEVLEGQFLIDTGATVAVDIFGAYAGAQRLADRMVLAAAAPRFGVGGAATYHLGRLAWFDLGALRLEAPLCGVEGGASRWAPGEPAKAGLVGADLLGRFRLRLEGPNRRLILVPGPRVGEPFVAGGRGLSVVSGGRGRWDELTVAAVIEESPAALAGLCVGDVIEGVNGRAAAGMSCAGLRALLRRPSEIVHVEVRRGGRTIRAPLAWRPGP